MKKKKAGFTEISTNPAQSLMISITPLCGLLMKVFTIGLLRFSWNGAFPNGSNVGAIFAEGVVWGGKVSDGKSPVVRVDGNTYGTGCAPIIRLYRVRPDWQNGDVDQDAADFNNIPLGQVLMLTDKHFSDQYATIGLNGHWN